jgi:site-specific DNA-methyltransferase (adenine-specific)
VNDFLRLQYKELSTRDELGDEVPILSQSSESPTLIGEFLCDTHSHHGDEKLAMNYLEINKIYQGRAEELIKNLRPSSISLSFWSPPYFVGKEYEKNETFLGWQKMLRSVIRGHAAALKPGGFMIVNIADILCFKDDSIPKFQAMNISQQKSEVTREMVLNAKARYPHYDRYQLADLLGCSEQTVDRRLNGNNIRGGKYAAQTRVKLVGGALERYAYSFGLYLHDHRIWAKDPAWANSKWTSNSLKAVHEFEDLYIFWKPGQQVIDRNKLQPWEWKEWGSRGIWYIESVRANDDHEAKFPLKLAERVVRLYSEEGQTVLDPFVGSGTTAVAAAKWGRDYVGFEKEPKYVKLANQNIQHHFAQPKLISL